ncbi:MAG: DUF1015 domain-containing protein [Candidatus Caldatribacteriota bacterium]
MPTIKPFRAYRPQPNIITKVAAPPYDVIGKEEAQQLAKDNPISFLHINKAEVDLENSIDPYDQRVYQQAKENLQRMIKQKVFIQDKEDNFYIYRQEMKGRVQTGLVACVSIDDYLEDKIKKHENTQIEKEIDRFNHIEFTDSNTGPALLTYKADKKIWQVINSWSKEKEPIYNFISDDGVTHICWIIDEQKMIKHLVEAFANIDCFYIADGHHRVAAATKIGLKRRAQTKNYTGKEEFNYFLAVLFPHNELYIMEYNRIVADLAWNSEKEFIQKISEKFTIEKQNGNSPYRPEARHSFGMYLANQWYKLTAKSGTFNEEDVVDSLDVSILQNNLLDPILKIKEPRTDKRIEFVGGIKGLEELEKKVKSGWKVAFSLYPVSLEELMKVADTKNLMPPKSTWFEPKLRSGIFIHKLTE